MSQIIDINYPRVVGLWKAHLGMAQEGDVIRIVTGEMPHQLTKALKGDFENAKAITGTTIQIIAGPIISVDEETGTNEILNLASRGILELWISPYRQLSHRRIIGDRYVYSEKYHEPLGEQGESFIVCDTSVFHPKSDEYLIEKFLIGKDIYELGISIEALDMQTYPNSPAIRLKTNKEIMKLKERWGRNYDFLAGRAP